VNGATGRLSSFNGPANLCVSGKYLYVADSGNNQVRKVSTDTGATILVAGSMAGYRNGNTTNALFNNLNGIAIDPMGMYCYYHNSDELIPVIFVAINIQSN
jgi:DNA-binding beta-propeller fold protein YncE